MTLSGQMKRGDMTSGNLDLFKMALGLEDPWKVTRTDFNPEGGRLDLYLDFPRGAAFLVPSRWLRAEGVSGARRRGQAVAPSRPSFSTRPTCMLVCRGCVAMSTGYTRSTSRGLVLGLDSPCCSRHCSLPSPRRCRLPRWARSPGNTTPVSGG